MLVPTQNKRHLGKVAAIVTLVVTAVYGVWISLYMVLGSVAPRNPVIVIQNQRFIVYGLKGEGFTRQHKIPVYSLIVMPEDQFNKYKGETK
jgi:hypothetical protein